MPGHARPRPPARRPLAWPTRVVRSRGRVAARGVRPNSLAHPRCGRRSCPCRSRRRAWPAPPRTQRRARRSVATARGAHRRSRRQSVRPDGGPSGLDVEVHLKLFGRVALPCSTPIAPQGRNARLLDLERDDAGPRRASWRRLTVEPILDFAQEVWVDSRLPLIAGGGCLRQRQCDVILHVDRVPTTRVLLCQLHELSP